MKKSEAFPGRFFKATELDSPRLLTFRSVVTENVNENEEKTIAYFEEDKKGLVISSTKWDALEAMGYGTDSEDWIGKQVVIYQTKVKFKGDIVPSIGLRLPKNTIKKNPNITTGKALLTPPESENPAVDMDDEIPF